MSTISFDADSVTTRIINRLKAKASWANILKTSTAQQLIEPFSEEISYLASYDGFLTRENKWGLSRNKTSLLAFTGIHRYEAHRQIGAEGVLTLSADETFNLEPAVNIAIPKYTQFSTEDDVKFVSKETYVITTADKSIDISAIQGIPRTFNYIATGTDFEEFDIDSVVIENSFYELSVNGTTWTKLENIYEAGATDESYELTNKIDFTGIYIKFGNNINGKKVENGDTIIFKYIETLGSDGNISASNTVDTVDSTMFDIASSVVDVYVKNDNAMVGGQDFETLEEIRKNAPEFFQTGDRASNSDDYVQIILNEFSYILKVLVWGTYENNIDDGLNPWTTVPLEDNNVFIATIRTDGSESLSTTQKLEISERLNDFKAPTDIVVFADGNIINIVYTIAAYISDKSYTLTEVKNNINTELKALYDLENRDFFEHIRFSDYIAAIDGVTGVDYHSTSISFYTDESFNVTFNVDLNLEMVSITPSSVSIYVKDIVNDTPEFLMGTDDGAGTIDGEVGYDLSGSTINYTTGLGGIALDNVPPVLTEPYTNYRVRVYYQTTSSDLLLKERNQIFSYAEAISSPLITTTYTT